MPEQDSPERAANLRAFETQEALDHWSWYALLPEENYLFAKYYKAGDQVLDLACGLGRTTLLLHEMGCRVKGIDLSQSFIRTAKRRFPYLDLQIGSFDNIDEPEGSYSHVLISFNAIDLAFPETQRLATLQECARVLKPGGTFIYSSHNIRSLHFYWPHYRGRLRWVIRNSLNAFREPAYIREEGQYLLYTSPRYVIRQTESVGFKFQEMTVDKMTGNERVDRYLSPYIHYAFRKVPGHGVQVPV